MFPNLLTGLAGTTGADRGSEGGGGEDGAAGQSLVTASGGGDCTEE